MTARNGTTPKTDPNAPTPDMVPAAPKAVAMDGLDVSWVPVASLRVYDNNPYKHSPEQVKALRAAIEEWGWTVPALVDGDGVLIAGHGRRLAALLDPPLSHMPVLSRPDWSAEQVAAYRLWDNQSAAMSETDRDRMRAELLGLDGRFDMSLLGFGDDLYELMHGSMAENFAKAYGKQNRPGVQVERFIAPPLSILDASRGYWQDRKRLWYEDFPTVFGAAGRLHTEAPAATNLVTQQVAKERRVVLSLTMPTSSFDPVLAEVAYTWWTRRGSRIYDPYAGGPVRGVVAATMGRSYLGVDIRQEQVDENYACGVPGAEWLVADGTTYVPDEPVDFVFSCPPYGSLEVYSKLEEDLSTMKWPQFRDAYRRSIRRSVQALAEDRFAAFVVGNFKDRQVLRDLLGETVAGFEAAGLTYWNDVVYATPVGTAAIRAQAHFPRNRRPMPRHQQMFVFVKGDGVRAAAYVTPRRARVVEKHQRVALFVKGSGKKAAEYVNSELTI